VPDILITRRKPTQTPILLTQAVKIVRAIPTRLTKTWRSTDVSVLEKYLNFVYAKLVGFNFVTKNDYTNVSTYKECNKKMLFRKETRETQIMCEGGNI
jgi:hypothetical protein